MTPITITVPAWIAWVCAVGFALAVTAFCGFISCVAWEYLKKEIPRTWHQRRNNKIRPLAWGVHDYILAVETGAPEEERDRLYRIMRVAFDTSVFAHKVRAGEEKHP